MADLHLTALPFGVYFISVVWVTGTNSEPTAPPPSPAAPTLGSSVHMHTFITQRLADTIFSAGVYVCVFLLHCGSLLAMSPLIVSVHA